MMTDDSGLSDVPDGDSFEEILAKLLKEGDKGTALNLHTEILNPDAMTLIDIAGEHWGRTISPGVGKLIATSQTWKRRNMVAYKRGRAKEIVEAVKAQVEEQRKKLDVQAAMLGRDR